MKTVMMQYEPNGEKFAIWQTDCETLNEAWNEIDGRPETGAWISFEGEKEIMVVNGGF